MLHGDQDSSDLAFSRLGRAGLGDHELVDRVVLHAAREDPHVMLVLRVDADTTDVGGVEDLVAGDDQAVGHVDTSAHVLELIRCHVNP